MNGLLDDITTTIVTCTSVCLNNGECKVDGTCACLPGYYGEFCQNIGYNGYSTIGAIAGAVICIVFLLLLTCMAFAAHIRGPQGNGESRLTRLVSVEARGNLFDENTVLAQNDFPPEYADAVSTGRGRRFSSLRLGSRNNSIDETEPRSPPPMYEIVIFGKKRKFSFRRGSKSRKTSELNEPNLDTKECIIEEVNEKYGDDVFVNGNATDKNNTQQTQTNEVSENTVTSDSPKQTLENNSQNQPIEQSINYEQDMNAKLEGVVDTCVVETISEVDEQQRHRLKHEEENKHEDKITIATS